MIVALSANLLFPFQGETDEPKIARIIGLSGSLIWTGNGGQIVNELKVGTELSGGTIEGMAPDSWFELEFNDGSIVMISGDAVLTFSDFGQKVLRLKRGRLSAHVKPQPKRKPVQVHTRSAWLTAMGAQFEVNTGPFSTKLHVSEGKVRIKRPGDEKFVNVPPRAPNRGFERPPDVAGFGSRCRPWLEK